ncbi:hypothetical protein EI613_18775 [Azospirillum sp. 412522]|nr:hypothetical protein [Azospirillum sp. 412522]MBY6263947.1 hypothetical protein [Azospirillum sp. 412522]
MSIVKAGQFNFNANTPNNTPLQIINPSSNVAGAVIRTATLEVLSSGIVYLIAGTSTPGAPGINTPIIASHYALQASGVIVPYSIELPPGKGLWLYPQATGGGSVNMSYDLYAA